MTFVHFRGLHGDVVRVNPEFVTSLREPVPVAEPLNARTKISTSDGASHDVTETPDEVERKLTETRTQP
jgi:hypothetical protein